MNLAVKLITLQFYCTHPVSSGKALQGMNYDQYSSTLLNWNLIITTAFADYIIITIIMGAPSSPTVIIPHPLNIQYPCPPY